MRREDIVDMAREVFEVIAALATVFAEFDEFLVQECDVEAEDEALSQGQRVEEGG